MNEIGSEIDDPYRWLEEVTGDQAMDWVRARNAESVAELAAGSRFDSLRAEIREVLDSTDRIPYVRRRGEYLYNFWQDADAPRGLWRRTTLERYRTEAPEWEVLLDIDALGAAEDENWVWQGAAVLRPGYQRALVELSRGGADATVVREFDLTTKEFVADGFTLPEAKSNVGWIDADRIYVGTDFGPGSLTTSGYPRVVREWRRGTPLAEAVTVYEGKPEDVSVHVWHDPTEGFERDWISRHLDFYSSEKYLRGAEGEPIRLEVPEDAQTSAHREWLVIHPRTEWTVGGVSHPAGSLLAVRLADFLAGERALTVLFEPDAHRSLDDWTWTRDHLILTTLADVRSELFVLTPGEGAWQRTPLPGVPEFDQTDIIGTDAEHSNEFFMVSSGFTQPATLRYGHVGGEVEVLKRAPRFFEPEGISVRQFFAVSEDGTRIPYFVVGQQNATPGPALLTGYGGFEISLTPSYSGTIGRGWLARGGTYVVANIRGGGEYGPEWHNGAIKANRRLVYEDFAAVATDLVARGISTAERLGIEGGSNGGLLMGVMLTRYPKLFGAIVCQVPLLDMRRYHELLAGASWMAEYGDPREAAEWEFIQPFSPYHNVRAGQPYPPTLFMTSTRDDRVHPGHARKMVARLLEHEYDIRYYENIEGGHGAAADNAQRAHKWALTFEFLWRTLAEN
ncbi:MAG TPA: prolyl oligopeptidase family serine peptidase [Pseudonocardiaceae bacterium]|jgi:prolyl oligopeptidase|nr:prolyl oligopeptidase family serine peptidase [Pseudonocardiaceae bacterium]